MTKVGTYPVRWTEPQRRVALDVLGAVANDPDWSEFTGDRDWSTFGEAVEVVGAARTPRLTGGQLRVLRGVLSVVVNAPDVWADYVGGERTWATFGRATEVIVAAHVAACRAESMPAVSHPTGQEPSR
jgi:hypothetical protein